MVPYRLLSILALAAYSPYALARSLAGKYRIGDWKGRLGQTSYPDLSGGVWIHAVSVGEVGVAKSLASSLAKALPSHRLGLSVTTAAGRELAERSFGWNAAVFPFPFDLAGPVEKALGQARPGLVVLTETEIWPLFLDRAAAHGIPVALVNGRVSNRSYRRYRLAGRFMARSLEKVSLFAMQTSEDAERIAALGAPRDRVHVTGNIKFDRPAAPPFADAARLGAAAAGRTIGIAASTGEGEEAIVLEAWSACRPRPLLVLAPRRPERFDEVAKLVEARGLRLLRRSSPASTLDSQLSTLNSPDVYLLDSIGELASVYSGARFAFIGGSLIPTGGQNPIEAWAQGVSVIAGPHMENFREIAAAGKARRILQEVAGSKELTAAIDAAVSEPSAASARGEEARRFTVESRGAVERTLRLVLPLMENPNPEKKVTA
jgi:3-deoxy-D-manno-octulosonic-acid transferase